MDDTQREMYEKKLALAYATIEELGGVVPTGFISQYGMLRAGSPRDISEALLGDDEIAIMTYLSSLGVDMMIRVEDDNLHLRMKLNGVIRTFEGAGIDLWS